MYSVRNSHEIRKRALTFVFHLQLQGHDPRIEALSAEANRIVAERLCGRFFDGLEIRYEMRLGKLHQFILKYAPDALVVESMVQAAELSIFKRMLNT